MSASEWGVFPEMLLTGGEAADILSLYGEM